MSRKSLLYKTKGRGSTFRLVGTRYPKEEVSTWESGVFTGGKNSRSQHDDHDEKRDLLTISRDRERSLVVVVSVAYYGVSGVARGAEFFGENVTGRMVFASKCTGRLSALKEVKASFQTVVDSEGFRTKVWRDEPGTATKGK